jgi:hypothetical protein
MTEPDYEPYGDGLGPHPDGFDPTPLGWLIIYFVVMFVTLVACGVIYGIAKGIEALS